VRSLSEKKYHELFRWGVIVKIVISCGEILFGVAFLFISYDAMRQLGVHLFGNELLEVPLDIWLRYAVLGFQNFAATSESFWSFLFISHGVVKLFLSWGLWRGKLWAFPTAAVIFAGFVVYQFYQLTYVNSIFLWLITIFDILLIVLVVHEYRRRTRVIL